MRSWKFWAFALADAALMLILLRQNVVSEDQIDNVVLCTIGVAFLSACLGMAIVRTDWTARALGVFGAFLGVGWLFTAAWIIREGWRGPLDREELYAVRSTLLLGGVLFNIGFWWWAVRYRSRRAVDV